jgi:hypothetical protein
MMSVAVIAAALALTSMLAAALYGKSRRIQALEAQLQAAAADLQHLQQACSRLAPATVVQQLIVDSKSSDVAGTAERKIATALFVDLVRFTEMSERLEAAVLVNILNGYYERMTDASRRAPRSGRELCRRRYRCLFRRASVEPVAMR